MRSFFVSLLLLLMFPASGVAVVCDAGYFSVGENCIESKFQITTTELAADTTFSFYMSAKGTFYVDWGDGNTQTITRTNTTETKYSHSFSAAGIYTIQFGGAATGYTTTASQNNSATLNLGIAAIRFYTGTTTSPHNIGTPGTELYIAGVSGSIGRVFPTIGSGSGLANQPRFNHLFFGARNIDCEIPANLFSGISGSGASEMFRNTFAYSGFRGSIPENLFPVTTSAHRLFGWTFFSCTKLTGSIPENLFNRAKGTLQKDMFMATFQGCTGLTGTIPAKLFSGITGGTADYAFYNVFLGCTGLTGQIPAGLFSKVRGSGALGMFGRVFRNCSGLTGWVPPTLFSGVSSYATDMMQDIFTGSGLVTVCPCGTTRQTTQFDSYYSGKVACRELGEAHWHNGTCVVGCGAGVSRLKTSTGISLPLLSTKISEVNLAVLYNNTTCYVPLFSGTGQLNVSFNGQTYYAGAPNEIPPE